MSIAEIAKDFVLGAGISAVTSSIACMAIGVPLTELYYSTVARTLIAAGGIIGVVAKVSQYVHW